jgi:hypothetical protein
MDNFIFHNCTRIVFGKGMENRVGEETGRLARRVLLHYGSDRIKKNGLFDRVVKSLDRAGVTFVELGGVQPNPRLSLVREGIELCRRQDVDLVLAVGGGSVIDSAKAIAIGVPYEGDVWDFYVGRAEPKATIGVGTVLTHAAAGSEASTGSVITNEEGRYKRPVDCELNRPKFSILNPELTFSLPPYQTACGVADIMSHVMERYFTSIREVDFTDHLCEATLKAVIKNAPRVLEHPSGYDARAQIMWASTVAHSDVLSTGRVPDWGTHNIEHEISAIYDVPHGAGLAVVFPAWMSYVYTEDLNRFVRFALKVWNVEMDVDDPEGTARAGIRRCREFFHSIGLPVTLGQLEVPSNRLEEMAAKAVQFGPLGQFKKLEKGDVLEILTLAG